MWIPVSMTNLLFASRQKHKPLPHSLWCLWFYIASSLSVIYARKLVEISCGFQKAIVRHRIADELTKPRGNPLQA